MRPTIAVIEDLHWADEATLDIIRLLARRAEALGALVVVTYRDNELDATHPVRLAVGELGTAPGVTQLRLPPLSRGAVEELAGPHGVDAGELYGRTAGNPFYVTEVLAGGGTEVPPTVRDAVLGRMSRLGAAAPGVLEAVAVVPPHVEMWVLDEIAGDEVVHVDACLARACCAARAGRCRSATSSRGSRSSRRSARTGACSCTGACSRRCAGRPTDRRPTSRRSPIMRMSRRRRRGAGVCDGRRRACAQRRERTARRRRSTRAPCASPRAAVRRSSPSCSSGTRTSATSRIRSRARSPPGARAGVLPGDRRPPRRGDGAVRALRDDLVPWPDRRVEARSAATRWRRSQGSSRVASWHGLTSSSRRSPATARASPSGRRARGRSPSSSETASSRCAHASRSTRRTITRAAARRGRARIEEILQLSARAGTRWKSPSAGTAWPSPRSVIAPTPISIATSRPGSPTATSETSRSTGATCTRTPPARRSTAAAGPRRPRPR